MDALWRVELLGGFRAVSGESELTRFRSQRTAGLLAYLTFHLGRWVPREVLMDLLWRDFDPESARASLRVALSSLRHQLEPPGVTPGTVIAADRNAVRVNPDSVTTDVAEFEDGLRRACAATDGAERQRLLRHAVARYPGDLLPGLYQDWVIPEQLRLREAYLEAALSLANALEAAGDRDEALQYVLAAACVDPTDEAVCRRAMHLFTELGQPAAARRQYEALQRALPSDPGADAAPELREPAEGLGAPGLTYEVRDGGPPAAPMGTSAPTTGVLTVLCVHRVGSDTAAGDEANLPDGNRQYGGTELAARPGSRLVAFAHPLDALACVVDAAWGHGPQSDATPPSAFALYTGDAGVGTWAEVSAVASRALLLAEAGHAGQVLCAEGTAGLLRPDLLDGVRLRALGAYRLWHTGDPERVYQVEPRHGPRAEFPPIAAQPGHVVPLPFTLTRLFGRTDEIDAIRRLLGDLSVRLVTLTGPPGTGKTRLAIETARAMTDAVPGRVWFVPLAALTDASQVPEAVLGAMGIVCRGGGNAMTLLVESLSGGRSLLVLDNLEHLVTGGAEIVQSVLERAPAVKCLVTSRRRLDLQGERVFPVAPLPVPDAVEDATPERLLHCPSGALFANRARAVRPDFQVTVRNAGTVGQLCRRLEGVPLALELAAARTGTMPAGQILAQLEVSMGLLANRRAALASRQRSMHAAIEWSVSLLAPEVRGFFARLSVFRRGWCAAAAEAVCNEPKALEYLSELADSSLIEVDLLGDEPRYRLLELLREYGWGLLTAEERDEARGRHAAYFSDLASSAASALKRPDSVARMDALELDRDNLRSAIEYWLGSADDAGRALEVVTALDPFWTERGSSREYVGWIDSVLAVDPLCAKATCDAVAAALGAYARACGSQRVTKLAHVALRRARERDDVRLHRSAIGALASGALDEGQIQLALDLFSECHALAHRVGTSRALASAVNNLGWTLMLGGFYVRARQELEQAEAIAEEHTDIMWAILSNRAHLESIVGRMPLATELFERSLSGQRAMKLGYIFAETLAFYGTALVRDGEYVRGRALLEEAASVSRQTGHPVLEAQATYGIAAADYAEGRNPDALQGFEAVLNSVGESFNAWGKASALAGMAKALVATGRAAAAAAPLRTATELAGLLGAPHTAAAVLVAQVCAAVALGNAEWAGRLIGAVSAIRSAAGITPLRHERDEYERLRAAARAALGESAMERAFGTGLTMTVPSAIAYALEPRR